MFNVGFKIGNATAQFFDGKAVLDAVGKAKAAVMSKAGAFIRRTAKGSIRRGKKPSQPGDPPRDHTGILRDRIFFGYDMSTGAEIIGPEKTNQIYFDHAGEPVSGTVPQILEAGGQIKVLEVWNGSAKKWVRADLRSKRKLAGRRTRLRTVRVAKRPFMQPALEKNLDKFQDLWGDVIVG